MVEPTARFEDLKIPLRKSVHGLTEVSAVLGVPQWWPTGMRIGAILGHGSARDLNDPVIEFLQRELTEKGILTLRFNFPFGEAGKKRADSEDVLRRTFRDAITLVSPDPISAPAHLFLGGKGLGGQIAADLVATGVRVDGVFFMGFPLHPQGKPDKTRAELLFRIISPMLFLQGERDRQCELQVLRQTLTRVGAPTALQVFPEADQHFKVLKKSERTDEQTQVEVLTQLEAWMSRVAHGQI